MPTTYVQRNTNSDLSVPGEYDLQLLEGAVTQVSRTIQLAATQTKEGYHYTEPGVPGADGVTGDYTVEVNIVAGDNQVNVSAAVARVNSSGTVQTQTSFSAEQVANGTVQTHSFTNANLGTWASGDRLRVAVRYRNAHSKTSRSVDVSFNTTSSEVVAPWAGEAPIPEASGTVAAEGSLSAAGQATPKASGSASAVGSLSATGSTPAVETFDPADLDVTINGTTAELTWSASPTPGVADYQVFRRTPQTGDPFDPEVDTPVATGITDEFYDDENLDPGDYDWQVFGRVPA